MRIGVRGGAIRCFSAPHRPICFSPSPPRCHCSSAPLPTFPRPGARSTPFEPAAVRCSLLFTPPHALAFRCCWCAGRGEGGGRRRRHHHHVLWQHPGRCPAPTLHPLPRAACRSIRSLCGETVCLLPCVTPCVVAAVRRVKDGGGENEPGLRARDRGMRRTTTRRTRRRCRRCLSAPSEVQPESD